MYQRCPNKISCPGSDSPIANLSSEAVEVAYWRAIGFCCDGSMKTYLSYVSHEDAQLGLQRTLYEECGECPGTPSVQYSATATCSDGSGSVTVYSSTSQEDADIRAAIAAADAACPTVEDDGSGGTITVACNTVQACSVPCASGGGTFTYTIAPCMVYQATVAQADALAQAYACAFALAHKVCLSAITKCCCIDEAYSEIITATPIKSLTWSVIGTLPPGLTATTGTNTTGKLTISGTPTTNGQYSFTVRATDGNGNYAARAYQIWVIEITDTELPAYTVGAAYSHQMTAAGGSGTYAWVISEGSLPTGLTMSESGLITGTPTAADETDEIEFGVTDSEC